MNRAPLRTLALVAGLLLAAVGGDAAPVRRFALVAGANDGGASRPELRYAVSDAERFARVLGDLGGVAAEDAILLRQPSAGELDQSLAKLRERVGEARQSAQGAGGVRTEVLVYYSGHADEQGLLLGDDRYSYRSLRDQLDSLSADVRIAVLDACASGAITRLKGGQKRPPFLIDESSDMRGHAFLTSSSETESAQESDRLGGSYFTHALVSGLRGAADASGEGKVTLNEAYQFAFNETLGGTVDTRGGAQHPSYDINLSGTGDVVITDLRQTSATLVLGEALEGRFFVRDAQQQLVVELNKTYGRRVELGLAPGRYEVRVEREAASLLATPELGDGAQVVLEPAQFSPTTPEPTRKRGGSPAPSYLMAGRNRLDLRLGLWHIGDGVFAQTSGDSSQVLAGSSNGDMLAGLRYTRFLREELALTFGADVRPGDSGVRVSSATVAAGAETVIALPVGARWNPLHPDSRSSVRPYLTLGIGPLLRTRDGSFVSGASVLAGSSTEVAACGHVGGGVDFHIGRVFSIGIDAGYKWTAGLAEAGFHDNYSGFELALNLGWLFGKGTPPRPR